MYACMTPVGFDTSDKFENHCFSAFCINFTQNLFKFFDPNSECFAKYDAFCSHILD